MGREKDAANAQAVEANPAREEGAAAAAEVAEVDRLGRGREGIADARRVRLGHLDLDHVPAGAGARWGTVQGGPGWGGWATEVRAAWDGVER